MEIKIIEIRDRATYIPVLAIKMISKNPVEKYHLGRAGYGEEYPLVMLIKIDGAEAQYDPFKWNCKRTMFCSHQYIQKNYDKLKTGDVVDIEFILGEKPKPKKSEYENVDLEEMTRNILGM